MLSVNVTFAVRVPIASGANEACTAQVVPAPKVAGGKGQLLVSLNSAGFVPVKAIELIVNAAFPELLTVIVSAALVVPITCMANVKLPGFSPIAGAAGPDCLHSPALPAATMPWISAEFRARLNT